MINVNLFQVALIIPCKLSRVAGYLSDIVIRNCEIMKDYDVPGYNDDSFMQDYDVLGYNDDSFFSGFIVGVIITSLLFLSFLLIKWCINNINNLAKDLEYRVTPKFLPSSDIKDVKLCSECLLLNKERAL